MLGRSPLVIPEGLIRTERNHTREYLKSVGGGALCWGKQHVYMLRYKVSLSVCVFSLPQRAAICVRHHQSTFKGALSRCPLCYRYFFTGSVQPSREQDRRTSDRLSARHVKGILPFIRFLMHSNETVFGRVPESSVLASPALSEARTQLQTAARPLTIHPSLHLELFFPRSCATGSAVAREESDRGLHGPAWRSLFCMFILAFAHFSGDSLRHNADEERIFKAAEWIADGVWCVGNDLGEVRRRFLHILIQQPTDR